MPFSNDIQNVCLIAKLTITDSANPPFIGLQGSSQHVV